MRAFDWSGLWSPKWPPWEVALRAAVIYVVIQLFFRLVGRKELGRYAISDVALLFLITTASRKSIVGDDSSLTSAIVGLGTLIGLDWLFSYASYRSRRFADFLEGPPRALVKDGRVQPRALHRARLNESELTARLHQYGREALSQVKDAYLERSGKITFVFWETSAVGSGPGQPPLRA